MDDAPALQGNNYLATAGVGSFGASPTVWQLDTYFRPWYFDGRVVHWGSFCSTRSKALEAAKSLAQSLQPNYQSHV